MDAFNWHSCELIQWSIITITTYHIFHFRRELAEETGSWCKQTGYHSILIVPFSHCLCILISVSKIVLVSYMYGPRFLTLSFVRRLCITSFVFLYNFFSRIFCSCIVFVLCQLRNTNGHTIPLTLPINEHNYTGYTGNLAYQIAMSFFVSRAENLKMQIHQHSVFT